MELFAFRLNGILKQPSPVCTVELVARPTVSIPNDFMHLENPRRCPRIARVHERIVFVSGAVGVGGADYEANGIVATRLRCQL